MKTNTTSALFLTLILFCSSAFADYAFAVLTWNDDSACTQKPNYINAYKLNACLKLTADGTFTQYKCIDGNITLYRECVDSSCQNCPTITSYPIGECTNTGGQYSVWTCQDSLD